MRVNEVRADQLQAGDLIVENGETVAVLSATVRPALTGDRTIVTVRHTGEGEEWTADAHYPVPLSHRAARRFRVTAADGPHIRSVIVTARNAADAWAVAGFDRSHGGFDADRGFAEELPA